MPPIPRAELPAINDDERFTQPEAASVVAIGEQNRIDEVARLAGRPLSEEEQRIVLNRYVTPAQREILYEHEGLGPAAPNLSDERIRQIQQEHYEHYGLGEEADRTIAQQEQLLGRDLTEQERDSVYAEYFSRGGLRDIDIKTNEILDRNQHLFKDESSSTSKIIRFLNKIKKPMATIGASVGLRFALKAVGAAVPGLGFLTYTAGTFTGLIVGGIKGYKSAEAKTRNEMLGFNGIQKEYQRILAVQNDPESRSKALAFLQNALESGTFKGNVGELLNLLVLYRAEAGRVSNLNIGALSEIGSASMRDYNKTVKDAVLRSGITGALKGAGKGALMGAVSDLVAFGIHWARMAHHTSAYLQDHYGAHNEIRVTDSPDIRDMPVSPDNANPILQSIDYHQSEWGHALSRAVGEGIRNGDIKPPESVIQGIMQTGNMTHEQAINQFIYDFNFAQPLPGHEVVADGFLYDFNKDGLQHLVDNTAGANGSFDYAHFADTLRTADQYLTTNYPAAGFDYTLHDQIPFDQGQLHQDAVNYATQHSGESLLEGIAHGAAIGLGVNQVTKDASAKSGEAAGGAGQAGEGGGGEETPQQQAGAQGAEGEEAVGGAPTPEQQAQAEAEAIPTEPARWQELLETNHIDFKNRANAALKVNRTKQWANMTPEEQNAIASLFAAIKAYNDSNKRFKITLELEGREYLAGNTPAAGSSAFDLTELNGAAATPIDFATERQTTWPSVKFVEQALPAGTAPDDNMINAGLIQADIEQLLRYRNNANRKIEILRRRAPAGRNNRGGGGAPQFQKVWAGDRGEGTLEIIGFRGDQLIVADSEDTLHNIPVSSLDNVATPGIRVSTW